MAVPEIGETLRLFDRKERHLVVQNCLGTGAGTMCQDFCARLTQTLGRRLQAPVATSAWWAADYHLEWLIGALFWHSEVDPIDLERPRLNEPELIRGNQEDIDLIVAQGNDVILVEAKGHTSWDNEQLTRKVERLRSICDDEGVVRQCDPAHPIRLHLILMSINKPSKVNHGDWPAWTLSEDKPYWMELKATGERIRVGRCDYQGNRDANGGHWRVWRESKLPPA